MHVYVRAIYDTIYSIRNDMSAKSKIEQEVVVNLI